MYNVTDSSFTKIDSPAGQAPPPFSAQVNAIHQIFQKIHTPQFKLPENDPITVQAQLKREALQAVRDDLNNHWGITKFFLFLLRLTPFKLDIERKADQILKSTGKLYLKASELGCTRSEKPKEYVEALNQAWLSRPVSPKIMDHIPDAIKALYRDPHASLEEFIKTLQGSDVKTRLELFDALVDQSNAASPLSKLLKYKVDQIDQKRRTIFELRDENIPEFNLDEEISPQIKKLPDKALMQLIFGIPSDKAYSLQKEALKELSSRVKVSDDNPDAFLVPDELKLSDEDKKEIADRLLFLYEKSGSKELPLDLIDKFDLVNEDAIKTLKIKVKILQEKSSHKLGAEALKRLDKVADDFQKELIVLAEANNTSALADKINTLKEGHNINFRDILLNLLKKKSKSDSKAAIVALFSRMKAEEREDALLLLSQSKELVNLLSINVFLLLPKHEDDSSSVAYLDTFKKLIDQSPKGLEAETFSPLISKMSSGERVKAIEHLLSKNNPFLYLTSGLLETMDAKEPIPYVKIIEAVLRESSKNSKPELNHVKLIIACLKRLPDDEKQAIFEKILEFEQPITFSHIKSNQIDALEMFRDIQLKKANYKELMVKNLKYADLLIASESEDKLLEIFGVENEQQLVDELGSDSRNYDLLKYLIGKKIIERSLIEEKFDTFNEKIQKRMKKDKFFDFLFPKEAK